MEKSKRRGRKQQEHFWELYFADSQYESSEWEIYISGAQENTVNIVYQQRSVDLLTENTYKLEHEACVVYDLHKN